MVTRADAHMVYRLFLHREPESEAVVEACMRVKSLEDLCHHFLQSEEFKAKFGKFHTPMDWPPIQVNVDVNPTQAAAMTAHVEATWHGLGQADPYWSVLSVPQFRRDTFEDHAEEFRQSGKADVIRFQRFADRAGLDLAQSKTCLELGCGVGRLTRWLIPLFPHVIAADISQAHLEILAKELQSSSVKTILLNDVAAVDSLPDYDVFFSLIVLQHNPPPIMARMLRSILARLNPGGLAYFQLPTYSKGYAFDPDAYLDALPSSGEMEMHVLPQQTVFEIATASNCKILEVREDGYTGNVEGISNTFFLQKSK